MREGYTLDGEGNRWVNRPMIVPDGPSIIVEGPDRVGKTTVVQHISKMAHIPAFKCPSEKEIFKNGGAETLAFDLTLTHFLKQTNYRFVSDRGYPSERVYSRVFNRESADKMLSEIDYQHMQLGTKILYLYSSIEPTEKDDIVPDGMYHTIKREYDRFSTWTGCRVTAVDTYPMLKAYQLGHDISKEFAVDCLRLLGETE